MPKFGRKKTVFDYIYSKPTIAVLMILVIFLGVSVFERYQVEREMAERRMATEEEYEALQGRKMELQKKVDYLAGERGIEEEVRKHFDVAKEGEQVVILLGEEDKPAPIEPEPETRKKWYQFWR